MTRFWFVRHGPTHAKSLVGWSDIPADLSDTAQIARLSDYLPDVAQIISSDLIRCVATADAIGAGRTRLPHDPDLRELNFGDWELKTWHETAASHPDLSKAYWDEPGDVAPPGGESWHEASARVSRGVDRLAGPADVIVVAHFGAILTQVQRAKGATNQEAFAHKIDNLSVTRLDFDGTWSVHSINHLP